MPGLDSVANLLSGNIMDGLQKLIQIWKLPPEKALEHQEEMQKLADEMTTKAMDLVKAEDQGQQDINKIEAGSGKFFINGWRPAVGWLCVAGLSMQLVVRPTLIWGFSACGHQITLPEFDTTTMNDLLLGMLGMGGLRTFEKFKNVEGNR